MAYLYVFSQRKAPAAGSGNLNSSKSFEEEVMKRGHKQATMTDAFMALEILGGINGVRAVGKGRQFDPIKYGDEFIGRYESLRNKLGDSFTEKLLANHLRVVEKNGTWVVEPVPQPLFHKKGWLIPLADLRNEVQRPDTRTGNFKLRLEEPKNDHAQILARLQDAFKSKDGWPSVGEFGHRIGIIEERLRTDEAVSSILKGFGFDFCIPPTPIGDVGKEMSARFVPALSRAYNGLHGTRRRYEEYLSVNNGYQKYSSKKLSGQIVVVEGSRHEQVIQKASEGYVVGKFFPCLGGYSVENARYAVLHLPDQLLLNGGFDTFCAIIGHIDNFGGYELFDARPAIPLAALQFLPLPESSLSFKAQTVTAELAETEYVSHPGNAWPGLVVLG